MEEVLNIIYKYFCDIQRQFKVIQGQAKKQGKIWQSACILLQPDLDGFLMLRIFLRNREPTSVFSATTEHPIFVHLLGCMARYGLFVLKVLLNHNQPY